MNPHYYIMRNKKILRLEAEVTFESLPLSIREQAFDPYDNMKLTQDQANWRVVLFRDEIMEMDEYTQWLSTPEAMAEDIYEYELTAN